MANDDKDESQGGGEQTHCQRQVLDNFACTSGFYTSVDSSGPDLHLCDGLKNDGGWCAGNIVRSEMPLSPPFRACDGDSEVQVPGRIIQVPTVCH